MTDDKIDQVLEQYSKQFPVPIMDIAKALGLKVYLTSKFPDKKSGQINKDNGSYSVYLNAYHPYTRNRFTLAHEIAHLKLHRAYLDKQKEIEDFVGQTYNLSHLSRDKGQARDQREVEADQLAAEILMPAEEFAKVWDGKKTVEEVAEYFGVSTSAADTRARVLSTKLEGSDRGVVEE
jgi:Zn-dependent peptidase ImmA (M78 family)